MKRLLVFLFFVGLSTQLFSQKDSQLNWLYNLDAAKEVSKAEKKPILIYFTGSDWCAPCKALKTDFFETEAFAERANSMVLVMIDYPRRMDIITEEQRAYNKTIMAKYNKNGSFPLLVMTNSKGKALGELSSYSSFNSYKDTSHHFDFVDKHIVGYN
ncbi:thioredoxin family protein [Aureisphaera galaxeae]|uniref:thioredoxin family protein n=1 Tax=Aureisphaera galaxeae TaxID=1538023 RepID=UPI00234FF97E|nr:thioredoxin family protein [Aureisphaera galaxeae]MDC8003844.1 thioredoxin family protein [Aureisphaera galaxeae]